MKFNGDIIITDPCYVTKERDESTKPQWDKFFRYKTAYDYPDFRPATRRSKMFENDYELYDLAYIKWDNENPDDWDVCDGGRNMEALGIHTYISRDTIYGDWSCHTFDSDSGKPIGEFCADTGMVAVFLLDEVLDYNPAFDFHITRPWTTTLIKNFCGDIEFVVKTVTGEYEKDTKWWKKGDKWEENQVEVVGHGVDTVTGKPINFVGKQTGI